MNRLISFATAALVLFMMAGCQAVEQEQLPVEPVAVEGVAPVEPPRNALNLFTAYSTGVDGVVVLVDRDTGCEFIGTLVQNTGGSSVAAGYTSMIPRPVTSGGVQKCRR